MANAKAIAFGTRCEQEALVPPLLPEDVDKLLAATGCATASGAKAAARKEAAAALTWLQAHKSDATELFDALPAQSQAALKKLYVVPNVQGLHWSRNLAMMLSVYARAASPPASPKQQLLKDAEGIIVLDDQRRPPDGEDSGEGGLPADRGRKRTDAERAYDALEEDLRLQSEASTAKKQKDRMVPSPAKTLALAVGSGGACGRAGAVPWLSRAELIADLPADVAHILFLGRGLTRTEASKALREEALVNTLYEGSALALWAHRISFELGSKYDPPDLLLIGTNLALVTRICLDEKAQESSRMVTAAVLATWNGVQDLLCQQHQVAESNLKACSDCIDGLMEKRTAMLSAMVAGCGKGGREVSRAVALQQRQVALIWPWMSDALAAGVLTSPSKSTANAVWLTLLGPAMDQRTGAAAGGTTSLVAATSKLEARRAATDHGTVAAKRKLATPAQQQAAPAAPAQHWQMGWAPTLDWGPQPPPGWGLLPSPSPMYAPPAQPQWAFMPPAQQQPMQQPPPQGVAAPPPLLLMPPPGQVVQLVPSDSSSAP